jgi:7-carboxy-7-deazaguanine synthase (Cx14CxxC type)
MSYLVKEVFATLQGEGAHAGRVSVFCRFARCNLWSGHEEHRASAMCRFCDTDFVGTDGPGGGRFTTAADLADHIAAHWPGPADDPDAGERYVVCTGGEPLLQLDAALVDALHARGFTVAVETNGTIEPPPGIDWLCVSPKAGAELVVRRGDELKLVHPQPGAEPERFEDLDFGRFSLQPMDGPDRAAATEAAIAYCLAHPHWRLSVQTHKVLGIP